MKKYLILASLPMLFGCTDYLEKFDNAYEENNVFISLTDGKFKDERDGNTYSIVEIAGTYWMAENLRYVDSSATPNLKGNVWCYENSKDSCSKYGPLYSWAAAMNLSASESEKWNGFSNPADAQGICPKGWRIPSSIDWTTLNTNVSLFSGGEAGASLKAIHGWEREGNASLAMNRYGFNALAAGRRNSEGGDFLSTGKYAFFWTSAGIDKATSRGWGLRSDGDVFGEGEFYKDHGMSIRCVADGFGVEINGKLDSAYLDSIPFEFGSLEIDGKSYKTIKIGKQNWMAENVALNTEKSLCYNDDSKNCDTYGRLYTLDEAKTLCPDGWRLPSVTDYQFLTSFVYKTTMLRSRDKWTDKAEKGLNWWGFGLLPAGGHEKGDFFDITYSSYLWTSDGKAYEVRYHGETPYYTEKSAESAFSVRCIED